MSRTGTWKVRTSPSTGNPVRVEPTVIVLYRSDRRFALDAVVPRSVVARHGGLWFVDESFVVVRRE